MNPHRANIINTIQLIASPTSQSEYQNEVPLVNVANELVNQWFDDFYHPGSRDFDQAFTPTELHLLSQFNDFYDLRARDLPDTLQELHATTKWNEVVGRAQLLLEQCGWVNLQARYDAR